MKIQKVAQNTLFLSVSQFLARVVGFFYIILLARFLAVGDFGIYTFVLALSYNFIPLADFGIERLVLRDLAREPERTAYYFHRLFTLRLILIALAIILLVVFGLILKLPPRQIVYLFLMGLSILPYSLVYLIVSFQNVKEKMEYTALANFGTISLTVLIGMLFVLFKFSLIWFFLAYVVGNFVLFLVFLGLLPKMDLRIVLTFDFKFCRDILKETWVFGLLIILSTLYLRLSTIMVGVMETNYLTGVYGGAYKFIEAAILLPQSLSLALFPLTARLFVSDKKGLRVLYLKSMAVLFALSIPVALFFFFMPRLAITLSYGPAYLQAVPVMQALGLLAILFFVNALPGNIIQNSEKLKHFLPFVGGYFLVQLVLCLLLIPRFSIVGAAAAIISSEALAFVVNNLFVWRVLKD